MQPSDLKAMFANVPSSEYRQFERVPGKLSHRRDLHAFMLLDSLVPGTGSIVEAATDDDLYLNVDICQLATSGITKAQVVELVRCGVNFSEKCLSMSI